MERFATLRWLVAQLGSSRVTSCQFELLVANSIYINVRPYSLVIHDRNLQGYWKAVNQSGRTGDRAFVRHLSLSDKSHPGRSQYSAEKHRIHRIQPSSKGTSTTISATVSSYILQHLVMDIKLTLRSSFSGTVVDHVEDSAMRRSATGGLLSGFEIFASSRGGYDAREDSFWVQCVGSRCALTSIAAM